MVKTIIIFVLGFFSFPLIADFGKNYEPVEDFFILPTYGIYDTYNGNCRNICGRNGHGWEFIVRDYYACNKAQIYISDLMYGKETPGKCNPGKGTLK